MVLNAKNHSQTDPKTIQTQTQHWSENDMQHKLMLRSICNRFGIGFGSLLASTNLHKMILIVRWFLNSFKIAAQDLPLEDVKSSASPKQMGRLVQRTIAGDDGKSAFSARGVAMQSEAPERWEVRGIGKGDGDSISWILHSLRLVCLQNAWLCKKT